MPFKWTLLEFLLMESKVKYMPINWDHTFSFSNHKLNLLIENCHMQYLILCVYIHTLEYYFMKKVYNAETANNRITYIHEWSSYPSPYLIKAVWSLGLWTIALESVILHQMTLCISWHPFKWWPSSRPGMCQGWKEVILFLLSVFWQ